jgi:hypothetical protein
MADRTFVDVDPATLHLPGSRSEGANPAKLQRQVKKFGKATDGMPPLEVKCGSDGRLVIYDGVTRATRVAKLLPGVTVRAEITGTLARPVAELPTVGEKL